VLPEEVTEPEKCFEGALKKISINAYERNSKARNACIKHYGATCVVCGFNFEKVYGAIGAGFIHVHHLVPLSEVKSVYELDPIEDLRPVCPNCHAIIHSTQPMLTIEELKAHLD
jgi:5-methylcytosine-specific restriction protein A